MVEPSRSSLTLSLSAILLILALYWTGSVSGQQCAKVITFNTGLTPFVADITKRQDTIQRAITASETDVLCLQEVWFESSMQSIIQATSKEYPYQFSALHRRPNQLSPRPANNWLSWAIPDSPCTSSEINYVVSEIGMCALRHACLPANMGPCLAKYCKNELNDFKISQSCLSCLVFAFGSIRDGMANCGNVPGFTKSRFNGPGLLLLSNKRILSSRYNSFTPGKKTFVQRGYLEAQIEGLGKVVCTHLTANMGGYAEFDLPFTSYEEQQKAEIQALSRLTVSDHILMGDLNTGPAMTFSTDPTRTITGAFPNNYQTLLSLGYRSPYADQVKLCTYCRTNRLTTGRQSYMFDHILLFGDGYSEATARRTMINQDRQTMSDHYGVEIRFCPSVDIAIAQLTTQRGLFQRLFFRG